jgi:lipoate synthase
MLGLGETDEQARQTMKFACGGCRCGDLWAVPAAYQEAYIPVKEYVTPGKFEERRGVVVDAMGSSTWRRPLRI